MRIDPALSANMATRFLLVLCTYVFFVQAAPSPYDREKDFLDDFGQWLETAQAAKSPDNRISLRGDTKVYDEINAASNLDDPQYWEQLALLEEQNHEGQQFNGELFVEPEWPSEKQTIGQIGGVATNKNGDAVVFHRGDRKWEQDTFKDKIFAKKDLGPIKEPTIVTMNRSNGAILDSWGKDLFYMPHGLSIDQDGNHWLTDVALHQVFKFGKDKTKPEMTFGKAFEAATNNDDLERFCKPTDVAVASSGAIFVADGYCNNRIVKISPDGKQVDVFGQDNMLIPHSLALIEDLDIICVADRENKRILCYNAGMKDAGLLGQPDRAYADPDIMGRVFAITYSKKDGLLYAVTAESEEMPGTGITIDMNAPEGSGNDIVAVWSPSEQGFGIPHDVAVSLDGANVYVGDLMWERVFKFDKTE